MRNRVSPASPRCRASLVMPPLPLLPPPRLCLKRDEKARRDLKFAERSGGNGLIRTVEAHDHSPSAAPKGALVFYFFSFPKCLVTGVTNRDLPSFPEPTFFLKNSDSPFLKTSLNLQRRVFAVVFIKTTTVREQHPGHNTGSRHRQTYHFSLKLIEV